MTLWESADSINNIPKAIVVYYAMVQGDHGTRADIPPLSDIDFLIRNGDIDFLILNGDLDFL